MIEFSSTTVIKMPKDELQHYIQKAFTPMEVAAILSSLVSYLPCVKDNEIAASAQSAMTKILYVLPEKMKEEFTSQMKAQGLKIIAVTENRTLQ